MLRCIRATAPGTRLILRESFPLLLAGKSCVQGTCAHAVALAHFFGDKRAQGREAWCDAHKRTLA